MDKTDRLLHSMRRPHYEERTPIATEMFLPNLSGDHSAGHTGTPSSDLDIANKKYVDDEIAAIPNLWEEADNILQPVNAAATVSGSIVDARYYKISGSDAISMGYSNSYFSDAIAFHLGIIGYDPDFLFVIQGADRDGAGAGGNFVMMGGTGGDDNGNGGSFTINGGTAIAEGGTGGNLYLEGGYGVEANGTVYINSGLAEVGGGPVTIYGDPLILQSLYSEDISIITDANISLTGNSIILNNLPTSDPSVAGALWVSGSQVYISAG